MASKNPGLELIGNGSMFAIDPGNKESGWVVVNANKDLMGHLDVLSHGTAPNTRIRQAIHQAWLRRKHKKFKPTLLIETPRPQGMLFSAEMIETTVEIGRFLQMWQGTWSYVFRGDVKMNLCGQVAKVSDANVSLAIKDRFGGEKQSVGAKKCDLCHGAKLRGRGKDRAPCPDCGGSGWKIPPGPLYKVAGHAWAALGVACWWQDSLQTLCHDIAGKQPVKTKKRKKDAQTT